MYQSRQRNAAFHMKHEDNCVKLRASEGGTPQHEPEIPPLESVLAEHAGDG
jgi:hypothetical protein